MKVVGNDEDFIFQEWQNDTPPLTDWLQLPWYNNYSKYLYSSFFWPMADGLGVFLVDDHARADDGRKDGFYNVIADDDAHFPFDEQKVCTHLYKAKWICQLEQDGTGWFRDYEGDNKGWKANPLRQHIEKNQWNWIGYPRRMAYVLDKAFALALQDYKPFPYLHKPKLGPISDEDLIEQIAECFTYRERSYNSIPQNEWPDAVVKYGILEAEKRAKEDLEKADRFYLEKERFWRKVELKNKLSAKRRVRGSEIELFKTINTAAKISEYANSHN